MIMNASFQEVEQALVKKRFMSLRKKNGTMMHEKAIEFAKVMKLTQFTGSGG